MLGPREGKGEVATCDFVRSSKPPQNAKVTQHFRPLVGPQEGRGEVATSDFVSLFTSDFVPLCWGTLLILLPFVGDPRECNFASHFLSFFFTPTLCCVAPLVVVRDSQSTLCCVAP